VLSATALAVALLSATPLGQAAVNAFRHARYATNAGAVDGIKASRTPQAGKLLALGANKRFPASVGAIGPTGPKGANGDTGLRGPRGDTGLTGPPGVIWKGNWDATELYAPNDAVAYGGSSYVAIEGNRGVSPLGHPGAWSLLAQQGSQGVPGQPGPGAARFSYLGIANTTPVPVFNDGGLTLTASCPGGLILVIAKTAFPSMIRVDGDTNNNVNRDFLPTNPGFEVDVGVGTTGTLVYAVTDGQGHVSSFITIEYLAETAVFGATNNCIFVGTALVEI
jgi:hypothetical protein